MENEIKVGDKYKGTVNGAIFEITGIDKKNGMIFYKWNDKIFHYGLDAFKKCLLEKM